MASTVALCVILTLGIRVMSVSAITGGSGLFRVLPAPKTVTTPPPGVLKSMVPVPHMAMSGGSNETDANPEHNLPMDRLNSPGGIDNKTAMEKQKKLEVWKKAMSEAARRTTTFRAPIPKQHTTRLQQGNNDNSKHIIEALLNKLQEAKARPERPTETTEATASQTGPSVGTIATVICCVTLGVTAAGVAALVAWHKCRAQKGAGENTYAVNYATRPDGVNLKMPGGHMGYPSDTHRSSSVGKPPAYPYPDQAPIPALEILLQQQQLRESQTTQMPADTKTPDTDGNQYSQIE